MGCGISDKHPFLWASVWYEPAKVEYKTASRPIRYKPTDVEYKTASRPIRYKPTDVEYKTASRPIRYKPTDVEYKIVSLRYKPADPDTRYPSHVSSPLTTRTTRGWELSLVKKYFNTWPQRKENETVREIF